MHYLDNFAITNRSSISWLQQCTSEYRKISCGIFMCSNCFYGVMTAKTWTQSCSALLLIGLQLSNTAAADTLITVDRKTGELGDRRLDLSFTGAQVLSLIPHYKKKDFFRTLILTGTTMLNKTGKCRIKHFRFRISSDFVWLMCECFRIMHSHV